MNVERFCHRMSGTALAVLWGVSLAWVPQGAQANVVSGQPLREELRVRMESPIVRELQVRLRHAKYFALYDVDDRFSLRTREGVRKFQEDHGLPPTGVVNQATWSLLLSKSRTPTAAELTNTDIGPWFTSPEQHGYLRELQHRLRQLEHYEGPLSGTLDAPTRQAVQAFRASQGLSPSEVMDERAWARLIARTRLPSYKQLFDAPPRSEMTQELDPRCAEGKVVCISKAQKKMSLVVDGQVLFTREARFSRPGWESPTGVFRIWYMNQDTVSTIFGERTPMPYAIFYDGNVAIHYSDDFAQVGYEGGSHGCSQLRDYQAAKWLFEQVKRGDKVVVY